MPALCRTFYNFSLRDELCIHRTLCRSSPATACLKVLSLLLPRGPSTSEQQSGRTS
uniref:Uncharacterized protein n=1 Tax=mine drainage metagenome TaxID=410659 RepID=E6QHF7_9ZZZZ